MTGNERREKIIDLLSGSSEAVSGRRLAALFNVSRQVIVQDIALLRAEGYDVVSTNTGYVLYRTRNCERVFKVSHSNDEVEDELKLIVDLGGTVRDVFVSHRVYGTVRAELNIGSRMDIERFLSDIRTGKSSLLMNITGGYHYHTVEANSEELLDIIHEKLKEKGYLAPLKNYEPVDFKKRRGSDSEDAKENSGNGKVKILGTGVATMDIYPDKKRMYPGGNEYNVVCNAALLGAKAGFLGVFGNDLAGELLEMNLRELKVDVSMCRHEEGSSGYSLVKLKDDGDRIFLAWNKEGVTDLHPVKFNKKEVKYVKSFDVVTMGRVADVSPETVKLLHERDGIDISYDFHSAFTDEDIDLIAPHIKYGFFSCSHLQEGEIKKLLKKVVEKGCGIAIGTRGCDPIIAYDGETYFIHEVERIEATDALGAGDSFIGAFLTDYLSNKDSDIGKEEKIRRALKAAADHAATVVVKEGSIGVGYDYDPPSFYEVINK
ncbi:MAG: HTH domain-containing protein [Lachnospiraceae bacterium]|nr:HTH domain-containing protein [Lachnospiraceae bacterium]